MELMSVELIVLGNQCRGGADVQQPLLMMKKMLMAVMVMMVMMMVMVN